jgi:hypothetical protein
MAKSMTREEALENAWAKCAPQSAPMDTIVPAVARWAGFHMGFRSGWEALMAEIRPLVNSLDEIRSVVDHEATVERLRDLVRDGRE